jgi:general secretion pathway protein H
MRTSTTSARHPAGFTLVEVLVVLLLLAITASLAVVSLREDDRTVLRREAERLADSFSHVQNEALLAGATFAWRGDAAGWEYLRRSPTRRWLPVEDGGAMFVRRLPEAVRLVDVEVDGAKIEPGALLLVPPSGMTSTARLVLQADRDRATVEVGVVSRVVMGHGS